LFHRDDPTGNVGAGIELPAILDVQSVHITGQLDEIYEDEIFDGFDGIQIMGNYRIAAWLWNNRRLNDDTTTGHVAHALSQALIPVYEGYPNFELNRHTRRLTLRNVIPEVPIYAEDISYPGIVNTGPAGNGDVNTGMHGEVYFEVGKIHLVTGVTFTNVPNLAIHLEDVIPAAARFATGTGESRDRAYNRVLAYWMNQFRNSTFDVRYDNGQTRTKNWMDFELASRVRIDYVLDGNRRLIRLPDSINHYEAGISRPHDHRIGALSGGDPLGNTAAGSNYNVGTGGMGNLVLGFPDLERFALNGRSGRDPMSTLPHIVWHYYGQPLSWEIPVARLTRARLVNRTDIVITGPVTVRNRALPSGNPRLLDNTALVAATPGEADLVNPTMALWHLGARYRLELTYRRAGESDRVEYVALRGLGNTASRFTMHDNGGSDVAPALADRPYFGWRPTSTHTIDWINRIEIVNTNFDDEIVGPTWEAVEAASSHSELEVAVRVQHARDAIRDRGVWRPTLHNEPGRQGRYPEDFTLPAFVSPPMVLDGPRDLIDF